MKRAIALAANAANNLSLIKAKAFIREQEWTHSRLMCSVSKGGYLYIGGCRLQGKSALQALRETLHECRKMWSKGVMVEHNRDWEGKLYVPEGGFRAYIFPRSGCPKRIAKLYVK